VSDKEPQSDAELEAAIEANGYKFINHGSYFAIRNKERGGVTKLEATEMSDALYEAWSTTKPE
jgi:hypothetical protein